MECPLLEGKKNVGNGTFPSREAVLFSQGPLSEGPLYSNIYLQCIIHWVRNCQYPCSSEKIIDASRLSLVHHNLLLLCRSLTGLSVDGAKITHVMSGGVTRGVGGGVTRGMGRGSTGGGEIN